MTFATNILMGLTVAVCANNCKLAVIASSSTIHRLDGMFGKRAEALQNSQKNTAQNLNEKVSSNPAEPELLINEDPLATSYQMLTEQPETLNFQASRLGDINKLSAALGKRLNRYTADRPQAFLGKRGKAFGVRRMEGFLGKRTDDGLSENRVLLKPEASASMTEDPMNVQLGYDDNVGIVPKQYHMEGLLGKRNPEPTSLTIDPLQGKQEITATESDCTLVGGECEPRIIGFLGKRGGGLPWFGKEARSGGANRYNVNRMEGFFGKRNQWYFAPVSHKGVGSGNKYFGQNEGTPHSWMHFTDPELE